MIAVSILVGVSIVAAFVAWLSFGGYAPSSLPPGAVLGRRDQAFVAVCADALFPPDGPIPWSGTEAGLVTYMNVYVARTAPAVQRLIRLLFAFAEVGPVFFGPRHVRFSRQNLDDRIAVLAAMSRSRIYFRRIAFLSLRTMLSMGYLAHPGVAQHLGMIPRLSPFDPASPDALSRAPAPPKSHDTRDGAASGDDERHEAVA